VNGPVNLNRLAALYDMVDRPDLKFRPFTPSVPSRVTQSEDIFRTISEGELLLHHPYQSFGPVTELLRQAAADSEVLAIKMTLYRTVLRSPVVEALIEAARNGKAVTAVIELRARFDEEDNIQIATRLKEAGASVVYGIVGFKAHAKVLLVVRREGGKLRRYVHLGTGNYHPGTSKAYTDISFMTADPAMGSDVHTLFNQLTGIGVAEPLSIHVDTYGTGKYDDERILEIVKKNFRLRPYDIIKELNLRRPIYYQTARFGHFGRTDEANEGGFTWETPKVLVE
jgi:polyphosphate kinase